MYMQEKRKIIQKLTTLKKIDMGKYPLIKQETITSTMTTTSKESLQKKIALQQVKNYLNKLDGVSEVKILERNTIDISWHSNILNEVLSYSCKIKPDSVLNYPCDNKQIFSWLQNCLSDIVGMTSVQIIDDTFAIEMVVQNLDDFLNSLRARQNNWDISLLFFNPEKLIVINDNEYELQCFKCNS